MVAISVRRFLPGCGLGCLVSLVAASVGVAVVSPSQVSAQSTPNFHYEFRWIHDDASDQWSEVKALTQDNRVLGQCRWVGTTRTRAFVWTEEFGRIYLDEVPTVNESGQLLGQFRDFRGSDEPIENEFYYQQVTDMNEAGQIVGSGRYTEYWPAQPAVRVAFRWTPPDESGFALLEEIDAPEDVGYQTLPLAINDAGDVAGSFVEHVRGFSVFLRTKEDGFLDLGRPAMSPNTKTVALSNRFANAAGEACIQLVASAYTDGLDGGSRAFRYTRIGESGFLVEDLGTMRSDDSGYAGVKDINDLGVLAGAASSGDKKPDYATSAFRYSDAGGMTNLGTLSKDKDYKSSWAFGINTWGEIVGQSHYTSSLTARRPFLYTDEFGMLDLTELTINVPWDTIVPRYFSPFWINDAGDIAGPLHDNYTSIDLSNPPKAFLLVRVYDDPGNPPVDPEPEVLTFSSTDTPKAIEDAHPRQGARDTVSTIGIAGTGASVQSLTLLLDISHSDPSQLSGELTSPSGTVVQRFARGELGGVQSPTINLDSSQPLDGTWRLTVRDHERGGTGTLNAWAIEVVVPQ